MAETSGEQQRPSKRVKPNDAPPATTSSPIISPSTARTAPPAQNERGRGGHRGRGGRGRGRGGKAKDKPIMKKVVGWSEEEKARRQAEHGDAPTGERRPKRKVALYVGYCGAAYSGLQINPEATTIEGIVFASLVKAGCISEDNSDDPSKVGLHRAARTDAGVHAAINMLSLKLILDPPSKADDTPIEEHINANLPDDIRVWRIVRVQNSFNPRTLCDLRTYRYTFPTHLLLPPRPGTSMANRLASLSSSATPSAFWSSAISDEEQLAQRRRWRADEAALERVRSIVAGYIGTHNFHNFTIGTSFHDRSSNRVMRSIDVHAPIVDEKGVEWITLEILGQSFMLHQIRKMIGLVILMTRSPAPTSLLPELFGPTRVTIPKAPALGLRLQRPHFERYNRRLDDLDGTPSTINATGKKDPLDYPDELLERVEDWCREKVEPGMRDDEAFVRWLQRCDDDAGEEMNYLNSLGVIPSDYQPKRYQRAAEAKSTTTEGKSADSDDEEAEGRGDAADAEG